MSVFYVYVLQNQARHIYVGFSADLRKRLKAHNYGQSKFTSLGRPWRLVYYEAFREERDAKIREKTLKNYGSTLGQLKKRLKFSLL